MPRCVIADSEDPRRRRLMTLLSGLGFEVLEARTGSDLRQVARGQDPHLLIVQSWLKDGRGASAIEEYRDAFPERDVYVLLLTETVAADVIYAGLEAGANDYLADAFDLDQLLFKLDLAAERGYLPGWLSAVEADRRLKAAGEEGRKAIIEVASSNEALRAC